MENDKYDHASHDHVFLSDPLDFQASSRLAQRAKILKFGDILGTSIGCNNANLKKIREKKLY